MYQKSTLQILEKSKFTQLELTKGPIASLVLTQYFDFLENSLSCGTFGLLSVGTIIVVCLCLQGAYFQRQAGGLNFEIISMFSLAILSSVWRQKASIYAPITMSQIPILRILLL